MPTYPTTKQANRDAIRGTKQQRGYGGEWSRISRLYRAQNPVCEICNDRPSDDVDHIKPFKSITDPLRTQISNLQAVCRRCHVAKTKAGKSMTAITWVCGPSGSGKSTYVAQHSTEHDLVYDMDKLAETLVRSQGRGQQRDVDVLQMVLSIRDDIINRIRRGTMSRRSWVIMVDADQVDLRKQRGDMVVTIDLDHSATVVPVRV